MIALERILTEHTEAVHRMLEQARRIRKEELSLDEVWAVALIVEAQGKVKTEEPWR